MRRRAPTPGKKIGGGPPSRRPRSLVARAPRRGAAFLALLGMLPARWLKWIYAANVALLAFIAFLVNLDTSIVRSIRLGDHLLLAGLLAAVAPLPFFRREGTGARRPS